jgi:hypothetical protein
MKRVFLLAIATLQFVLVSTSSSANNSINQKEFSQDYLRAKKILLRRRRMQQLRESTMLSLDSTDFDAQVSTVKGENSPVTFLFGDYMSKISDREHIKSAKVASNLTGMTDDDMESFKKAVKSENKKVNSIKGWAN